MKHMDIIIEIIIKMDIKVVTIFFEERMTSRLHKETTTKKGDRL